MLECDGSGRNMFERFTDKARHTVVLAQEEARALRHDHIGTEHLLLGLLRESDGAGASALTSLGIGLEAARDRVAAAAHRPRAARSQASWHRVTSPSPRRPSGRLNWRCEKRCSSGTTTSALGTSCWVWSATRPAAAPPSWLSSAPTRLRSGRGLSSCGLLASPASRRRGPGSERTALAGWTRWCRAWRRSSGSPA